MTRLVRNKYIDWYIDWLAGRADGADIYRNVLIVGLPTAPVKWDDAELPLLLGVLKFVFEKVGVDDAKES